MGDKFAAGQPTTSLHGHPSLRYAADSRRPLRMCALPHSAMQWRAVELSSIERSLCIRGLQVKNQSLQTQPLLSSPFLLTPLAFLQVLLNTVFLPGACPIQKMTTFEGNQSELGRRRGLKDARARVEGGHNHTGPPVARRALETLCSLCWAPRVRCWKLVPACCQCFPHYILPLCAPCRAGPPPSPPASPPPPSPPPPSPPSPPLESPVPPSPPPSPCELRALGAAGGAGRE